MPAGTPWTGYRLRVGTPVRLRERYDGVIAHYGPNRGEWMVRFADGEIVACRAIDLAAHRNPCENCHAEIRAAIEAEEVG